MEELFQQLWSITFYDLCSGIAWIIILLLLLWLSAHNSPIHDETKLSKHRIWHCIENGLIKTIQTISHNLAYVCVKLTFIYCGLRLILVYPNPQ